MATIFTQALQEDPAYAALMAELSQPRQAPKPMFTPQEAQQRVLSNNRQIDAGLLGQLAGDRQIQQVGGQVFRQALGDREERTTQRGITDPLTGDTRVDPAYQEAQDSARQARILQLAVGAEEKRRAALERVDRDRENRQHREDLARLAGSFRVGKAGTDAELNELRKEQIRAGIEATRARTGAAEDKADDAARRREAALVSARQKVASQNQKIDETIAMVNPISAGLVGSVTQKVPGFSPFDLAKNVDTIKARLGFDELMAMRAASPTGGALGNVSNKEIDFLQAAVENLDPRQKPETLRKNLEAVKTHYANWLAAIEGRDPSVPSGMPPATSVAPGQPSPGAAPPVTAPGAQPVSSGPPPTYRWDPAQRKTVRVAP